MAIQLETYQWITLLLTVITTVFSSIKFLLGRVEDNLKSNFRSIQDRFEEVASQSAQSQQEIRDLERKMFQFQIDLPHAYVARDDYIRGQTVIEAKLDAVAQKLENVQIKQGMQK